MDKSIERIRFTVIHELAHLLLQFENNIISNQKQIEKYCHYFSSSFLLPNENLISMIGKNRNYIAIQELISIKEYYGISMRAIILRLKELSIISEIYYKKWMVYLSKTSGHKDEPGSYNGVEKQKVFEKLINRAIVEGSISLSKAASLLNIDINELRKSTFGI